MSDAQKIARNTLWQIIGKVIGTLASGLVLVLLTRYLSQEEFGFYGTALALTQFVAVLADLGIYVVCLKEISARPEQEEKIFNNFFGLRLITSFIIFLATAVVVYFLPYNMIVKQTAALFCLGFIFASLVQLFTALFQKRMAMGAVALAEAIGRLAMLAIIYLLIHQQVRLPWLASASVIASGISFIWLTIIISNKQKIRPLVNWQVWQSLLKQTWPVSLGVLLNLVYFRADSIIMSLTRPASDVGIYTAPYKLLEIIVTFPHMFMGLIMPLTGAAWVIGQQQRLNHLLQRTSEFFLIITMPMLMASLISGEKIMSLIAGKNYEISGTILFPLMLATVAIFAGTTFTYLIVTIEKQKIMLINYAVAASGALILYFWLIPTYSYIAASWITAGIEVFIALSAYIICQRFGQIKLLVWPLIKIIICGIIMLIALWLFNNFMIIEQLLIGLIIYLLVLFIFGAIKKKDFQAIIKLKSHV